MARAWARAGGARARRRKRIAAGATMAAMSALLVACGGDGGPPTLTWYTNPDSGGQAEIAKRLQRSPNEFYRMLDRLVKRGWLRADWGVSEANQRAKFYRLTAAGKAQLAREQDRWSKLVHAIGRIMTPAPADSGQ